MNRHVVLSPRAAVQGRWQEAFGAFEQVNNPRAALALLRPDAILWLDASRRDWLREIRAARPDGVVVATTLIPSAEEAIALFESGVRGYCHALAVPEMLRQVATVVANGGLWLGPDLMTLAATTIARSVVPRPNGHDLLANLSPRERDVAVQVLAGACNKEVARNLDITPRTVKAHMSAIFEKLHVRDRLQLVVALRQAGMN